MIKQINELRINMKAREWCKLPYPGHPNGCPNYNDKNHVGKCPPTAPLIHDFIDTSKPMYLIVEEFNLSAHVRNMFMAHPDWSERQAKCVLYWQGGVNSRLEKQCQLFKSQHPNYITTRCPEAMGVNVIATAQKAGISIKPQPVGMVYKIALAGVPNGKGNNTGTDELLPTQLPLLFQ